MGGRGGGGVGEQRRDRMRALTQFSAALLCSHITGRKTWRRRGLPHLVLPDSRSQSHVGTGPGTAEGKDRHPSIVSMAGSPSSIHRCGSQVLQILQPLVPVWGPKGENKCLDVPFLVLNQYSELQRRVLVPTSRGVCLGSLGRG